MFSSCLRTYVCSYHVLIAIITIISVHTSAVMAVHKSVPLNQYLPQDLLVSEPVDIPSPVTSKQPQSPLLKIEECSTVFENGSSNHWKDDNSHLSPERVGNHCYYSNSYDQSDLLAASPKHSHSQDDLRHNTPSSPLLVAMRNAVDSLNKYEDFKILEKIGAGFFAEVFKVNIINYTGCVQLLFVTMEELHRE